MILHNDLLPDQYNPFTIRAIELASIRMFVEMHKDKLTGRVLDFGAGKQPYRDLCTGEYMAYDKEDALHPIYMYAEKFDAILCNQVIEYLEDPKSELVFLSFGLKPGGHLILSYPTTWPEVPGDIPDYLRFTALGMERMLKQAGFEIVYHDCRAAIDLNGFVLSLGGGIVGRRRD